MVSSSVRSMSGSVNTEKKRDNPKLVTFSLVAACRHYCSPKKRRAISGLLRLMRYQIATPAASG